MEIQSQPQMYSIKPNFGHKDVYPVVKYEKPVSEEEKKDEITVTLAKDSGLTEEDFEEVGYGEEVKDVDEKKPFDPAAKKAEAAARVDSLRDKKKQTDQLIDGLQDAGLINKDKAEKGKSLINLLFIVGSAFFVSRASLSTSMKILERAAKEAKTASFVKSFIGVAQELEGPVSDLAGAVKNVVRDEGVIKAVGEIKKTRIGKVLINETTKTMVKPVYDFIKKAGKINWKSISNFISKTGAAITSACFGLDYLTDNEKKQPEVVLATAAKE